MPSDSSLLSSAPRHSLCLVPVSAGTTLCCLGQHRTIARKRARKITVESTLAFSYIIYFFFYGFPAEKDRSLCYRA
ncbi:hypothetical protein BJY04DRAFT_198160 [Aspergillus karnatakaensis]|uniref:uncharacterized protein n=1 Tax=Aspergillus karnatakaensis TaxID=1810916 RepID=UPI003CCCF953